MTRLANHAARPALDFTTVPRRVRRDGWTVERQRAFISALAETGSLRVAAAAVNMSEAGAIWLRKQAGAESFSAAWDAAVGIGTDQVRAKLIDHSLNGVPEPVFHAGRQVGERRRFNHRSMMWLVEKGERAKAAERVYPPDVQVLIDRREESARRDKEAWVAHCDRVGMTDPEMRDGPPMRGWAMRQELVAKFAAMHDRMLDELKHEPEKLAAYKLLHGDEPIVDDYGAEFNGGAGPGSKDGGAVFWE